MNYLKNVGISILYVLGILFVLTFLITVLNYFNLISGKTLSIFKISILFLSMFIGGFIIGKKSQTKGWLEGLKLGLILLIVSILFNYLAFDKGFQIKNIVYDIILLISCMFGSMIGINKSPQQK